MTFQWPKNAITNINDFRRIGPANIWYVDDLKVRRWLETWGLGEPNLKFFSTQDRSGWVIAFGNYWDAYAHALRTRKKRNEPKVGA